jgi:hypothetical protein
MKREIFHEDIIDFLVEITEDCDLGDGCPELQLITAVTSVFGEEAEEMAEWVLSHSPFKRERVPLYKGQWEWVVRLK